MRCPKCQTDFPDWHFYCPNCRTQAQEYVPEANRSRGRNMLEKTGKLILELAIILFLIGAGVVIGRKINWKDVAAKFRGAEETSAPAKSERVTRPGVPAAPKRHAESEPAKSESPAKTASPQTAEPASPGKPQPTPTVESVRQLSPKIEELQPAADSSSTNKLGQESTASRLAQPAGQSIPTAMKPTLGVEQAEQKLSGELGVVNINSYVPARIYVDGQYSGTTPRTVTLTAGNHHIRLMADGYEDWGRRVRLKSNQQVGVMASLKKKAGQ